MINLIRRIFTRTPAITVGTRGTTSHPQSTGKRASSNEGYRKDLDKNFRSSMEANVYRYITECHPDICLCEFEPHLFTERDGLPHGFNYLPDFRCTTHEGQQFYIEVKGVWDARSLRAMEVMKRYRPDIILKTIGPKEYKIIKERFAKSIKGWE